MIDETLRASILAPWGGRVHDFDLQVGEYVIPKEVMFYSSVINVQSQVKSKSILFNSHKYYKLR